MDSYNVIVRENIESGNYNWLYVVIDLAIFFLLLYVTDNWILAFIISSVVGYILKSRNPLSKTETKDFSAVLKFEEDQIIFFDEKEGNTFSVPFNSISEVDGIKTFSEEDSSQILIKRYVDSEIILTLNHFQEIYKQETFEKLLEELKNKISPSNNDFNNNNNLNNSVDNSVDKLKFDENKNITEYKENIHSKFCSICGKENKINAKFCYACGNSF